jgi:hypothetical protein
MRTRPGRVQKFVYESDVRLAIMHRKARNSAFFFLNTSWQAGAKSLV